MVLWQSAEVLAEGGSQDKCKRNANCIFTFANCIIYNLNGRMFVMNIDELWDELIDYEGKEFFTKSGLPFTYEALDDRIIISRDDKKYSASENVFLLVLNNQSKDRQFYRDNTSVSSYVLGIMNDSRIGAI